MSTASAPPAAPPGPGRRGSMRRIGERRRDALGMFTRLREEYGPFVAFRMGPLDMYLVTDPDMVQEVFTTHAAKVRKGRILEGARVLLGDGLLTAQGEHHRRQRRLIQPAFHHERLAGYADTMSRTAAELTDTWPGGAVIDVHSEMTGLTMAVTADTLFGADLTAERARIEAALADVLRAFDLLVLPFSGLRMRMPTQTVRRFRAAKDDLDALVDGLIARRRAEGGDRGDLLSTLLLAQDAEDGTAMTDEEVRHEVMTLLAAGLETTANSLAFTWRLLALHPADAGRVREEALALGGPPGIDDLPRLAHTGRVLQESMRLFPPAWMIARRAVQDVPLGPYVVPAGGLIMTPPWLLHRDPERWEDARSFRPDRWEPGGAPPHRFSYLPFGAGTRKCIGSTFATLEGTLMLAAIAGRVRLSDADPGPLALAPQITLRPRDPLLLRVER